VERGHLLNKRILFMTGKGGAGKTTLAAALAVAARDRGKRVCLVGVGQSPNLCFIFSRDIPVYVETPVEKNLTAFTLDPYKALEEYVGLQLRVETAARMILSNRLIHYFMQAAPGWRELVTLGKIWHLHQLPASGGRALKFDIIVVDAPATGHGLSFLRVPSIFMNIIRFGPMQSQTFDVQSMLTDKARTAVCVASTLEEMPVNEAMQVLETVLTPLGMGLGVVFANSVISPLFNGQGRAEYETLRADTRAMEVLAGLFPDSGASLFNAAEEREKRAVQSRDYLEILENQKHAPVIRIPHQYPGRVDLSGVKKIADIINAALDREA
jgi:anion-transporting  ArsA/GET3 family ATPase